MALRRPGSSRTEPSDCPSRLRRRRGEPPPSPRDRQVSVSCARAMPMEESLSSPDTCSVAGARLPRGARASPDRRARLSRSNRASQCLCDSSGRRSSQRPCRRGRRLRSLECPALCARALWPRSCVSDRLLLGEKVRYQGASISRVQQLTGRSSAECRVGALQPLGRPFGGVESPGVARLPNHGVCLPYQPHDSQNALALLLIEALTLLDFAVDGRAGQVERVVKPLLRNLHTLGQCDDVRSRYSPSDDRDPIDGVRPIVGARRLTDGVPAESIRTRGVARAGIAHTYAPLPQMSNHYCSGERTSQGAACERAQVPLSSRLCQPFANRRGAEMSMRWWSRVACGAIAAFIAGSGVAGAVRAPTYLWRNVTVGGGGFAPDIIFSRAERGLAYLRTDMGGVYRWSESQHSWIPLEDDIAQSSYFGIESIAADPVDPNVVYLAAGMYAREPAAILRSEDRGNTWQIFPTSFHMGGNAPGRGVGERLAIDPSERSILYFGSRYDGLQRSTDRGRTWSRVASFPIRGMGWRAAARDETGISFVVFDP